MNLKAVSGFGKEVYNVLVQLFQKRILSGIGANK